jgi:N-acetylglucosamine-6-phosphate deacetylase
MTTATSIVFANGLLIRPGAIVSGWLRCERGRIVAWGPGDCAARDVARVDLHGAYLAPGFIDLHVHGGDGADFMDGTADDFATVLAAHLRHGTTSLLPTSTVARHEQICRFLELCSTFKKTMAASSGEPMARVLGAHLYGPYFAPTARGCHPAAPLRCPESREVQRFLEWSDAICTATIAPELPGAEAFARACAARGIRLNVGHSHATFDQVVEAIRWGARHVDHLFCAMSDRARLRQTQHYPMRGGVMEATLFFDELTTEIIADGKHLAPELLRLAAKVKGPDRLALVTDANRALDMPDGEYIFGPQDGGEPMQKRDGVGLTLNGLGLASGVMGLDHAVRVMHAATHLPLYEVIRMVTLTPARIAGFEDDIGSLDSGKRADFVVLDQNLQVQAVYRDGMVVHPQPMASHG